MRIADMKATPAEVEKAAGKVPVVLRAVHGIVLAWSECNSVPSVVLVQPRGSVTYRRPFGHGLEAVRRSAKAARLRWGDTIEIGWCAGTLW